MYYEPNDLFLLRRENAKEDINLSRVNKSEDMPAQKTKALAVVAGGLCLGGVIVYSDGDAVTGGVLFGLGILTIMGIGMWHIAGSFLTSLMHLRGDSGSSMEDLESLHKPEAQQSGWNIDGRRTG